MPRDMFSSIPTVEYLLSNYAAFECATALLGGQAAQKRFRRLIDDALSAPELSRRLNRELDALEDLLGLRHVHDDTRVEAMHFAMIDPASPAVADICALLDGLRDARAKATVG
ncbi:hypothetical protein E4Z66_18970 [Aliishimia ponticola]|uniref:Uncharacterized protein n=1 Tax=Aliishimia ponticola TaxID=2499833 RepID=A0A4S4N5D0_9RHOB|nr:hypothetical protein [Aliishimia ponticola]THH34282.1 hypothetical protein E4Z66_18970 [Aliishimia ponticola]